jgi:hypothetical protein
MFNNSETLQSLLDQVVERVTADYGIDIHTMFDLHTGAPIGRIDSNVFHTALIDEGALDDSEDGSVLSIEELSDSLLVRCMASMRPSPALNRPTTQTLKRLLESQPIVVVAYLLNRYRIKDWRTLTHRDDSWFETMLVRVDIWKHLSKLSADPDLDAVERSLRVLAHWLLELDSKCNLHTLTPAVGWFEKFALFATPLIVEADRLFQIGNRMTSSAYIKSWFDHPDQNQRKVEIAGRIKGKSRQALYERYGSVELGAMLHADDFKAKQDRAANKAKLDSRIIKGRSARSKAAQLVNKHSAAINSLFRTLTETTDTPHSVESTPKPVRATGLPMFVKKD